MNSALTLIQKNLGQIAVRQPQNSVDAAAKLIESQAGVSAAGKLVDTATENIGTILDILA